jgi:hypothetical protein
MTILGVTASSILKSQAAYESIASFTGTGGGSDTITFSSIPSTYKHLQIRGSMRNTYGATGVGDLRLTFNSDSTSNYAIVRLIGLSNSVVGFGGASQTFINIPYSVMNGGSTANLMGSMIIDIPNYRSTKRKTAQIYNGGIYSTTEGYYQQVNGFWLNTSAITSISLLNPFGAFLTSASTISLYGIKG